MTAPSRTSLYPVPAEEGERRDGLPQWLLSLDHKRIGLLTIGTSLVLFFCNGALALTMRAQLAQPSQDILGPQAYLQFMTMHGTGMITVAVTPLALGLGVYLVPLQVGAPRIAAPRATLLGYWLYVLGALTLIWAFLSPDGAQDGWWGFTPLSNSVYSPGPGQSLWTAGVFLAACGMILQGSTTLWTLLRMRAPGVTLLRIPVFCWSQLVTCLMVVAAFPPLLIAMVMLAADRISPHSFGVNRIIEYHGDGLAGLTAMDRHVIANMGAELGATTTVFPSDEAVLEFLHDQDREQDYTELRPEPGAGYDVTDSIDLAQLEPLIAAPSSPGNVVPVREVAGEPVFQVVIGSSANPGLRDFAIVAEIVTGRQSHDQVSFDINPASRQTLADLTGNGWLSDLIAAGARIHQSGCLGCIGMGQAPASGRNSLRTVPRNFPGRSGAEEDSVWLCSPETAAAAALTGVITDPRDLGVSYPRLELPRQAPVGTAMLVAPLPAADARKQELVKGPNIASLPEFDPLPDRIEATVELKAADDISTDEILPAGAEVLPLRSNIPAISRFVFRQLDADYADRVAAADGPHLVVAGENYGQGSSREHAVIAPRYLGLRAVIAKSFARIHFQNLANFGILPLRFEDPADYESIGQGDVLTFDSLRTQLSSGEPVTARHGGHGMRLAHDLSERQVAMVLAGGRIPLSAGPGT